MGTGLVTCLRSASLIDILDPGDVLVQLAAGLALDQFQRNFAPIGDPMFGLAATPAVPRTAVG